MVLRTLGTSWQNDFDREKGVVKILIFAAFFLFRFQKGDGQFFIPLEWGPESMDRNGT